MGILSITSALGAAERTVVLEIFADTHVDLCISAAKGAETLASEHPGKILVVEYHIGDPFFNLDGEYRMVFYQAIVQGYPVAVFDGTDTVCGGVPSGSMYPQYSSKFNTRKDIQSTLEITLENNPNLYSAGGTLTATVKNTGSQQISGKVFFTVTESNIPYTWQDLTTLDHVERIMLPDGFGKAFSLPAGQTTVISESYQLDPAWFHYTNNPNNIEYGCFIQKDAGSGPLKEILQSAVISGSGDISEENPPVFCMDIPTFIMECGFVTISLDKPSKVKLNIYDACGRYAKTIHDGYLPQGKHHLSLVTHSLSKGIFFVVAEVDQELQKAKLTRLK